MNARERLIHILILSAFLRWLGPRPIPRTEEGQGELIERYLEWKTTESTS